MFADLGLICCRAHSFLQIDRTSPAHFHLRLLPVFLPVGPFSILLPLHSGTELCRELWLMQMLGVPPPAAPQPSGSAHGDPPCRHAAI